MTGHRKTIGRNFNSQAVVESSTSGLQVQYFTLKTGRKVKFSFVIVPASEVADKTFVRQETNGRDQSALTKDSLKDITRTLRFQQFFACIGVMDGEKIEILDGSRRRASAIEIHAPLNVMVTSDKLTAEEARQLAKDIQTAKEHNIREIGLRLLSLKESGLNQKEIAEQEGLSQAKVTRAIQAATVPQELISLFPVQYELSFSDYKNLSELNERLSEKNIEFSQLVENISSQLVELVADDQLQEDEKKAAILYNFLDESKLFKGTVRKEDRSLMNVPFVTGDADLDAKFVKEAKEAGFESLKGHRSVGGMRASIYNAMPIEGVEKLVEFMRKFEKDNLK